MAVLLALSCGDMEQPVAWSVALATPDTSVRTGSVVPVRVEARIARGWYVYSITQPDGGPVRARIWLPDSATFSAAGDVRGPKASNSFDESFGINVEKYRRAASFIVPVRIAGDARAGTHEIRINARYQACNDRLCLPAKTVTMSIPVTVEPG